MKLLPGNDGGFKGTLACEYAKRICLDAGVENPMELKVIFDGATAIFIVMNKVAQTI